ncbi:hypothetical protein J2X45_003165 [Caulobacter sp. BE264]|nr:hypothetical protein [Caulobacter sp. BE264]
MSETDDDPDYDEFDDSDGIGCANCHNGWHHGCMDDMCRGSVPDDECPDARPCRVCNPQDEPQL